jgi:hypothetical protein
VKALSGRQPWWWAILHGGKRIENRRWNTTYRGPILLHAAKGCTAVEYREALTWMIDADVLGCVVCPELEDAEHLPRGGIVGRARIVDVIPPGDAGHTNTVSTWGLDTRWHMKEQFGFVLADVEPLPFVPLKGALGLFEVPDELLRSPRTRGVRHV